MLMLTSCVIVIVGIGLGWLALRQQIPSARAARRPRESRPAPLGLAARPPLYRRALRRHLHRLLLGVGALRRLARSPRLGRHRRWRSLDSSACGRSSIASSTPTASTAPSTKAAKRSPPAAACSRACKTAACRRTCASSRSASSRWWSSSFGAAAHEPSPHAAHRAAARRRCARLPFGKHARGIALVTAVITLFVAGYVWTLIPANGSIGLVELAPWAPSLGIEYHLGVDAPRRADAGPLRHRHPHVHRCRPSRASPAEPLLRARPHPRVRPLRLLHRAQFLPLVPLLGAQPHPRLLPHQALGRIEARPRCHAVLRLHHGRLGGLARRVPRRISLDRTAWTSRTSRTSPPPANSSRWSPRISAPP